MAYSTICDALYAVARAVLESREVERKHCWHVFIYLFSECTLWVSEAVLNSIPAGCLEQYADVCGEGASVYDMDVCKDAYN